jgi:NADH-quinone oxidoreductase subunit L
LAIIGVPGFSGFFSKDEILWKAFIFPTYGPILWGIGFLAAGCTAFYMVRLLCLTFYGVAHQDGHAHHPPHETPWYMWGPLVVLAFLSVAVGYLGVPDFLAHLVGGHNLFASYLEGLVYIPSSAQSAWGHLHAEHAHQLEWGVMLSSVVWVTLAAATAVFCYANRPVRGLAAFLGGHFPRIHRLLLEKYRVDEWYQSKISTPLAEISTFLWQVFDVRFINGCVNWVGYLLMGTSGIASFRMTGSLHRYGFWVLAGTVGVLIFSCF